MIPILSNVPLHPSLTEAVEFLAVGQIMVLFVLGCLMLFITLNGAAFIKSAKKPEPVAPAASEPAPAAAAAPAPTAEEVIPAVIAAAVAVALDGQAHQIVRISPARDSWASEGRRQIFSSHRVR